VKATVGAVCLLDRHARSYRISKQTDAGRSNPIVPSFNRLPIEGLKVSASNAGRPLPFPCNSVRLPLVRSVLYCLPLQDLRMRNWLVKHLTLWGLTFQNWMVIALAIVLISIALGWLQRR
jgi:hypothetical protein